MIRRIIAVAGVLAVAVTLGGCSTAAGTGTNAEPASQNLPTELRFGYFPNFTHAPAIIALEKGYLQKELGKGVKVTPVTFNAGPAAIEALFGNAVDITLAGPNPTITGYTKSHGEALKVVAGAASGGAGLVVRQGINSPADLKGKTIATPSLGNTQDVALRYWLKQQGFNTTTEGGGDVHIMPEDNATALQAFIQGKLDGAWVPQPWVTQMVEQGHGTELVNEASLWPSGKFVVTNTVASTAFLKKYPDAVKAVIAAELDAIDFIKAHPKDAATIVNDQIKAITGSQTDPKVLETAWNDVTFTIDPLPATLLASAAHAHSVGLLDTVKLDGLYDLKPLNSLLEKRGEKAIPTP
ncbi:ABC transporter substrate-binding protein [Diaminobutyricibacter sp. McL0608]|uniref:ABC transporter substrate-binding protein n=1 Tax=Leifsonia sp. McL0608 TaxID=3143537 RepID=UPI0031F33063